MACTRALIALLACMPASGGCLEGHYAYAYHGTVLCSDGITPAQNVRLIPHPANRDGLFGPGFDENDPNQIVTDADGHFSGTMRGWFSVPLLFPVKPQENKADKVWVYLPYQAGWKAVVVPVRAGPPDQDHVRTIDDVRVVLPEWYHGPDRVADENE